MSTTTVNIEDVVKLDLIQTGLKFDTKQDAIHDLCELLASKGYLAEVAGFEADVLKRETQGPTGIGFGVAIPHGKSSAVNQTALAICKTTEPISWESVVGPPEDVSLVILFAVRDGDADVLHLKLLQKVAVMLADDEFVDGLHAATEPQQVFDLFISKGK